MGRTKTQPKPLPDGRKLEIIHSAIGLIESRIRKQEIASSMSDLIRLLEMEAELSGRGAIRETRATWVDPEQTAGEAGKPKEP